MLQPWTPQNGGKKRRRKNRGPLVALALVVVFAAAVGLFALVQSRSARPPADEVLSLSEGAPLSSSAAPASSQAPAEEPAGPKEDEMRAMWISYLEWEERDISTEALMRAACAEMYDNCVALGLNTVVVAVRPFGDSFYPSEVFPWSHQLTGTQGQDPGYDPLAVLLEEAKARGLRFEAWVNPYRVNGPVYGPEALSEDNPAAQNPEWYTEINGAWYDPGLPEVRELIVAGMREIAEKYDVDGIHIDDYFYPEFSAEQVEAGENTAFDAASYEQYGEGKDLAEWRRENVNLLVQAAYAAIKEAKPEVTFGVSPQGNNDNNYNSQYSDVKLWMANPGYVDYVAPQLYWGFEHVLSNGKDTYAFGNISTEWASWPRDPAVKLYAGLGLYRIGAGDGSAGESEEWLSGGNIASMVQHLWGQEAYSGFLLFRYDNLYRTDEPLAAEEAAALTALLAPPAEDPAGGVSSNAQSTSDTPPDASGSAASSSAGASSAPAAQESTP